MLYKSSPVLIPNKAPIILNIIGFTQSLQANSWIPPRLGHEHIVPNFFRIIIYLLLLPGAELSLISESLAFSKTFFFHFSRSWAQVVQFLIFIWQMSCLMLTSHLYLGLPCDLLIRGFQLNIFLTVLVSDILCT